MPQMAPLSWIMLFIYFILIFMFYNLFNYFIYTYKIKSHIIMKNKIIYNWKW